MNYNPLKGVIQISPEEAKRGAEYLLYAIRKIKVAGGLPLTPYKHDDPLSDYDFAMHGILDGAKALGMDLGGSWGNEIDSTNHQ
jgi:hypothetical protein